MDLSTMNPHINAINVIGENSSRSSSSLSSDRSRCFRCVSTNHYVSVCPIPPRADSSQEPARIQSIQPRTILSRKAVEFQPSQVARIISRAHSVSPTPTSDVGLQLRELEREVSIMGIDTVLDTLLEYRYSQGIESEDE